MKPEDAKTIYDALVRHDGPSLRPDLPVNEQERLTDALDSLRLKLRNVERA